MLLKIDKEQIKIELKMKPSIAVCSVLYVIRFVEGHVNHNARKALVGPPVDMCNPPVAGYNWFWRQWAFVLPWFPNKVAARPIDIITSSNNKEALSACAPDTKQGPLYAHIPKLELLKKVQGCLHTVALWASLDSGTVRDL